MALTVETGKIVDGADSYVSLVDAQAYLTARGDVTTMLTEEHVRSGCDYINHYRLRFKGNKRAPAQSNMQWPRTNVFIDGKLLDEEIIPDCIINAQIESALEIASGRPPLETLSTRILKRKTVGPITKEWDTSQRVREQPSFDYRKVKAFLFPVLKDLQGRTFR